MGQLLRNPLYKLGITQYYKPREHLAIDCSWYGTTITDPINTIYASASGIILDHGIDVDGALYVVLLHDNIEGKPDNNVITRYWHLRTFSDKVSKAENGTKIIMGDSLGMIGDTGKADGYHLHYETWVVPKNYTYSSSDKGKYAVNPCNLLWCYSDQTMHPDEYDYINTTTKNLAAGIADYTGTAPAPSPIKIVKTDYYRKITFNSDGTFTFEPGTNILPTQSIPLYIFAVR